VTQSTVRISCEHLERGRDQAVREVRLRVNGDGIDLHLQADAT